LSTSKAFLNLRIGVYVHTRGPVEIPFIFVGASSDAALAAACETLRSEPGYEFMYRNGLVCGFEQAPDAPGILRVLGDAQFRVHAHSTKEFRAEARSAVERWEANKQSHVGERVGKDAQVHALSP
jgi:hypothetical protein